MSHITLWFVTVRPTRPRGTKRDYDKLSALGHQQARWLGAHLRDTRTHYPRVYCGTLTAAYRDRRQHGPESDPIQ